MSLAIDTDKVDSVLLADGWHKVHDHSFDVDSYEFTHEGKKLFAGGHSDLTSSTGFSFIGDGGLVLSGPLTSVLAVRCRLGAGTKAV